MTHPSFPSIMSDLPPEGSKFPISSPSSFPESSSSSLHHSYSRKQKSLGLLCTNFLALYNRDGIETVGLDDAASKLGVERRRIYDIVNVLESVGVLTRRAKNQYTWKGFAAIPAALKELQDEGVKDTFHRFYVNENVKGSDDDDDAEASSSQPNTSSQTDTSRPGSLSQSSDWSKLVAAQSVVKWKKKKAWRGAYFPKFNVTVAYHIVVPLANYQWWYCFFRTS